jgi:hypothetical protein
VGPRRFVALCLAITVILALADDVTARTVMDSIPPARDSFDLDDIRRIAAPATIERPSYRSTDDWICWNQEHQDTDDDTLRLDVVLAELVYDCRHRTFSLGVVTSDTWQSTDLALVGLWLDADRRPGTGCGGFERFVVTGYDTEARRWFADNLRTPSCTSTTWRSGTGVTDVQVDGTFGFASIEVGRAAIGNPATFRWYGVAVDNRTESADFFPDETSIVAATYPGASVGGSSAAAFRLGVPTSIAFAAERSATGDFNGDGRGDLLLDGSTATDMVRLGTPAGRLAMGPPLSISGAFTAAIPGDFNGDGLDDVLLYAAGPAPELLKIATGGGAFRNASAPAIGDEFDDWTSGDFNGDGRDDIAFAGAGSKPDGLYLARRGARFEVQTRPKFGVFSSIRAGDFNRDDRDDVWVYAAGSTSDHVFAGRANGTFARSAAWDVSGHYEQLLIGDMNGDERPDLLLANPGEALDVLRYGSGPMWFRTAPPIDITLEGATGHVLDVDGDDRDDVLWLGSGARPDALWMGTTP